jgi:hypothetical protein
VLPAAESEMIVTSLSGYCWACTWLAADITAAEAMATMATLAAVPHNVRNGAIHSSLEVLFMIRSSTQLRSNDVSVEAGCIIPMSRG